ncbi:hypothetical protein [Corynebacterium sp. AOP40-4SA-5]|uniref:hypothetical protein n=1 Tax=Corynebacterium sp. AOP40-4SA-5 TaxID=3457678 RepID=UPI0040340529
MAGVEETSINPAPWIFIALVVIAGWIAWKVHDRNRRRAKSSSARVGLRMEPIQGLELVEAAGRCWTFRMLDQKTATTDLAKLKEAVLFRMDMPEFGWTDKETFAEKRGELLLIQRKADAD